MKTIVILYPTEQRNDAEHAIGVLEEELDMRQVFHHSVGKEIIQTQSARFIFRDVFEPIKQNRIKKIDKLYVSQNILDTEEIKRYDYALEKDWLRMPTSGIIEYLQEVDKEINKEKVVRYEIESGVVKKISVESYKADRSYYFKSEKEALVQLEKIKKTVKEEIETKPLSKKKPRKIKKPNVSLDNTENDQKIELAMA